MIDTHTHIDDAKLAELQKDILASIDGGVLDFIINNASDRASLESTFLLARQNKGVFAAIGCHPHTATQYDEAFEARIRTLACHEKVVAVGEIGLDYYYDFTDRPTQRKVFERQLLLSGELRLPVCLHVRDAYEDAFSILSANKGGYMGGVLHCYSGSKEMALRFAELGLYFGFGGPITYKNANKGEIIDAIPKNRLLTETDCPYLTPRPKRGEINRPEYVEYPLLKIAEVLQIDKESAETLIKDNAVRLFTKIADFYGLAKQSI